MTGGITVHILGDFGPFSRMGKSIGYLLKVGRSRYLIDCGAPLFQQIGGHGLKNINGLIITHCHDDHKRWFSDLALFRMYAPDVQQNIFLITSEGVHDDIVRASMPALGKSLSKDSKNIIDLAYEDYIEHRVIGPRARYRIVSEDEGNGKTGLYIKERNGGILTADRAKIIINQKTKRPRMLFKDPVYGEWIEPESFYTFSSEVFYEEDKNIYRGDEGFTIEAIKAPVWHGVTGIGIRVKTGEETLIFSSDTAHDKEVWRQLYAEKRPQRLNMSKREFETAAVIYGDITDYIERVWSEERYREAIASFDDGIVIHDVSVRNSIVHTDYEKLMNTSLNREKVILTHSPDRMTSEWVLCNAGKSFNIKGNRFLEVVDGELYPMNADLYHKEEGRYYVGYKNAGGRYTVYEKDGLLRFSSEDGTDIGRPLYTVDLYEDIRGKYFPKIEKENSLYYERSDGRVELIEFTEKGSKGRIVENYRGKIKVS